MVDEYKEVECSCINLVCFFVEFLKIYLVGKNL